MSAGIVTAEEVRADFARKLHRRFQAMMPAKEFGCLCNPPRDRDHEKLCPGYYWERASWILQMLLAEENEELDAHG
ncbi:MAG: hypothetical protein JOZ62_08490 [Acidobacteriaceae bacterium]|nr:hypothetical protein [Acidobacteriaceae bacterium]